MAEPKKETVRIALPPRPETLHDPQNGGVKRDTARIVLPPRPPAIPPRRSPPTITPPSSINAEPAIDSPIAPLRRPPLQPSGAIPSSMLQPLPKPAASEPPSSGMEPAAAENFGGVPAQPGPKNETARIAVLPKPVPVPKPAVNMTKTQPLIMRPAAVTQTAPVIVATSSATDAFDSIPRGLCWGLLGLSALILFLQIWNYAVS